MQTESNHQENITLSHGSVQDDREEEQHLERRQRELPKRFQWRRWPNLMAMNSFVVEYVMQVLPSSLLSYFHV